MKKITRLRTTLRVVALLVIAELAAWPAHAASQLFSNLSYVGYHTDAGAIVVDTSGTAKLRVSFLTPTMARVQIAPTGVFTNNPSPAVAQVIPPLTNVQILDQATQLVVKASGLSLHLNKAHLRVDAYDGDDINPLSLESTSAGTSWDTTSGSLSQSRLLDAAEHIYGLGEDNANRGTLDRRGTVRDLWTGQQINSGNVTANYPVPFYLSSGAGGRGYGIFVDNVWHMQFDVGKTTGNQLAWTAPGGPIDYYIINGPSFKSVINQYTQLTGRPTMLPLYAFGYWQSRCFFNNFADIQQTVNRFKSDGLPLDVLVIDSNWSNPNGNGMDYKWNSNFLSGYTASAFLSGLHAGGAKVMLSTKGPMLRQDADIYPDALSKGLLATDGQGHTLTVGYYGGDLMDFTHPVMESWLTTQLTPLSNQGVDAWWLDLIEPEGEPSSAVYYAGKSADIHNTFPLLNFRTYFDYQRSRITNGRPVSLGRAASAGTQRYSGIVWTGDITSDWPTFQAHLPEAQNTGLSGLPYWANDSGGFLSGFLNNDQYGAHAELYERWFEFTCFAPITRAHKAGPAEPYQFGAAVEAAAKKYLQLRYRLLPYIYTVANETATTGLPMLRPLILEFQNDPGSANAKTEFMFGSNLLVAPVIWANATARQVYFPPGNWISYDDGFETAGTNTIGVAAPRDRIPLFVRAGTILPTVPDMMFTSQKPWDPITLEVWPAGDSTGSLYQDDGATTAFTTGEFTTTTFHCVEQPGTNVVLDIQPSNQKFGPAVWIANFHLTSVPTAVTLDGQPVPATTNTSTTPGWAFNVASNLLTVRLPGALVAHSLAVTLDGSSHPRPAAPQVAAPPLNGDLVAFYDLNETGNPLLGNTLAYDYVGGNNATYGTNCQNGYNNIAGPRFVPDGLAGFTNGNLAVKFTANVANSQITLPAFYLNTNTVTLAAWVKPQAAQNSWAGIIFCRAGSTVAGLSYTGTQVNGNYTLGYNWNNDQNVWSWNSTLVVPTNQWSLVALSVGPTAATIYVMNTNGTTSATHAYNHVVQNFDGVTLVGDDSADGGNGGRGFNGLMDNVAIYRQTLSLSQLTSLFNSAAAPTASFTSSRASGFAPLAVTFTDNSSGSITNRHWNFGDGSTLDTTGTSVPHIFTVAGTYLVTLVVAGASGMGTNTLNLAVASTPTNGQWTVNFCCVNTVNSDPGTPYVGPGILGGGTYWNPMPGVQSASASTTYRDDGATNSGGITFSGANVTGNYSGVLPYTIQLLNVYSYFTSAGGATFTFGNVPNGTYNLALYGINGHWCDHQVMFTVNGVSQTLTSVQDKYFAPDNTCLYTNVMVTNNQLIVHMVGQGTVANPANTEGDFDGAQLQFVNPPPPVAGFSGAPTNLFATQTVVFTNTSAGSITNAVWSFGDGNTASLSGVSAGSNVTETYTNAGSYVVQLIVSGAGGASTNTRVAYIVAVPLPVLGGVTAANGGLIFSGVSGPAGMSYRILAATNLAAPAWLPIWTNVFAPDGSYGYTNSTLTNPANFFRLVAP